MLLWATSPPFAGWAAFGKLPHGRGAPVLASPAQQAEGRIDGVVRDADTKEPLAGAIVSLPEAGQTAVAGDDGAFRLTRVAPGVHAVRVDRLGYRSRTVEGAGPGSVLLVELEASPIPLDRLVVTGGLTARAAQNALRPVSVVAGEELQSRLQGTVAGAMAAEPGLAAATMGPATARPVIRGLGGDRVLLLEDGARVGDVSGSSADHATALDASSARRIEVVRGPAAILYGSNALGGVVNVIRDEIPSSVPGRVTGSASLRGGTAAASLGGSAAATFAVASRIPVRVEASSRRAGDLNTPAGALNNTGAETWSAGAGTSYLADWGHAGASFRSYRNDYGIPGGFEGGHADGVAIKMERMSTKLRAVVDRPAGPWDRLELHGSHTWYRHQEIEPPDILGTLFKLQASSAEALVRSSQGGPFSATAVGARASREDFAFGGSTETPDSRRTTLAAFAFQEMDFGPVRLEGGLRYDWTKTDPVRDDPDADIGAVRDRTFGSVSGLFGVLYSAGSGVVLGATAGRAFRTPDVNELYSEGPHLAAYVFEVGNPSLGAETGTGMDVFLRFGGDRFRGELTGFHNSISGYVYGQPTGELSRVLLPVYQFQGADAVLSGFEAAAEWDAGAGWALHGAVAHVRGSLRETGRPLPLVPPLRGRAALEYDRPAWFARAEAEIAAKQDRTGEFESATDGYAVFHAGAGVRITVAGRLNVLTARLENATDENYRNHLSRVKDIMPEAGRGLAVAYRVVF